VTRTPLRRIHKLAETAERRPRSINTAGAVALTGPELFEMHTPAMTVTAPRAKRR